MRYAYLGDRLTRPALVGKPCDPELRPDGKCIVGKSKQLVRFASGETVMVLRRRLRRRDKLKGNPKDNPEASNNRFGAICRL